MAAGRGNEETGRRVDDEGVVLGVVDCELGEQRGEGCHLVVESWRNAEKSLKSDVKKINVIESVDGNHNSRSSNGFRARVSDQDFCVKMRF